MRSTHVPGGYTVPVGRGVAARRGTAPLRGPVRGGCGDGSGGAVVRAGARAAGTRRTGGDDGGDGGDGDGTVVATGVEPASGSGRFAPAAAGAADGVRTATGPPHAASMATAGTMTATRTLQDRTEFPPQPKRPLT
ncbi:hypothetical protein [Actinacidiphila rubida]|nr:hypothetical protein [Actinacidiphila rubida]